MDEDNSNINGQNLKGQLLLSAPFLGDIFKRSVILISENNAEGSVGFVLNKATDLKLHQIIEDFPEFDAKVLIGGPVEQSSLNFIHKAGDVIEDSFKIFEGVYWGGNFEQMKILIESGSLDPVDFRFFLGYSGWSPGQLENELATKSWYLNKPKIQNVFSESPENLWGKILRTMGNEFSVISTFPDDPSLN
ncbi:MAG: YqgE/AlgH family protein [Bacteroidetes bacterium]|nr:YqgE/AlgH family protein [Bacteroidota bacterium]